MPQLSYQQSGLTLQQNDSGQAVRDLQHDLRSIGYLRHGIDGGFGGETTLAVKALQYDLLTNQGASAGSDGHAPVKVVDYNGGRVTGVDGLVGEQLAACISDILDDTAFPKLPFADNPVQANQTIAQQIAGMSSEDVPVPFLVAILKQESGLMHFRVPSGADQDNFIVVGLDRNGQGEAMQYAITSRGYGAGQYTLFHHPPTADEVQKIMLDPTQNVLMAIQELKAKFDRFVVSNNAGADDRLAEFGTGPLRICKYAAGDPLYMKDCKNCALTAGNQPIVPGVTPFYQGSANVYQPTQYYNPAPVKTMPTRKGLGCDWPYAVRRYNGSGVNSYWYQALVLNHVVGL